MKPLDDGIYEVLVIEALERDENAIALDLVVVSGDAKDQVVSLRASGLKRDATALIGLPATLHVVDGRPRVVFE